MKIIINYPKFFDHSIYHDTLSMLNHIGHIPIPPYLKRKDELIDYELYQTIYSLNLGSIAATTAGLHVDSILIKQ